MISDTPHKKAPLLTPLLLLFMLAMILANLGGNMYGPLEALYLKQLGAGIGQIGLFYTLSQIIPLLLQILGGWISDSLGRLRAIAIGSVVGIFVYVPLILASRWEWVLIASALSAVTRSLIGPSFDAFIADHSAPDNRARLFGVTQTLFGVVSVVGPLLGGYLVEAMKFKGMLVVAAVLYLFATAIRVGMAREASRGQAANSQRLTFVSLKTNLGAMIGLILAGGLFTWIMITDGVRDIFFNMSFSFLSVYMQDIASLSISQIGLMSSIFGVAMMAVMIPAGWLADKAGERVNIAISFLFLAISIGMIAIPTTRQPGVDVRPWLGDRRDRRWPGYSGLSIADQQSSTAAFTRRSLWPVQHQPGIGLSACPGDWRIPVGKCQPSISLYADCFCVPVIASSRSGSNSKSVETGPM